MEMQSIPILAPAAVLVLWSLVVLMWMVITRFGALSRAGITLANAEPGGRYVDIDIDRQIRDLKKLRKLAGSAA